MGAYDSRVRRPAMLDNDSGMTLKPYFKNKSVIIYQGNCIDVMWEMADKKWSVDHTITDPPYDAVAHAATRQVGSRNGVTRKPLDFEVMQESDRLLASALIASMTKRWMLTFCQIESLPFWRVAFERSEDVSYRRSCIWLKPGSKPQLTGDRPGVGYEAILAMHRKVKSRWNGGGRSGVFTHVAGRTKVDHMTAKPMSLMYELIELFTDPGDVILDPFCGSGTLLRAAQDLGRKAIGIEIDPKFCELSKRRVEAARSRFVDRSNGDGREALL